MIEIALKYIYFFILPTFFLVFGLRLLLGNRTLPQRVLGLYFLVFCIRNLSAYQLAEASSAFYIYFHLVQSPLHYLLGPLSFLFCFYALRPYRRFKWYDLFHFLPFILHLIELLPYFLGPVENKFKDYEFLKSAGSYINYPSIAGVIPVVYHVIFKLIYSIAYLILETILWFRYTKKQHSIFYKNNYLLLKWIGIDIFFKIISFTLIVLQIFGKYNLHSPGKFEINDVFMFLGVLVNFIFFIFFPKLLNGALFESLDPYYFANQKADEQAERLPTSFEGTSLNKSLRELQIVMEVEAPYLKNDFSIKTLASYLNMTERNLSKLIHQNFEMSFPDFVGSWRLNYLKKIIKKEEEKTNLTIEKMAEKSGFGSRQALYKVVQRLHQTTPNKFLEINDE